MTEDTKPSLFDQMITGQFAESQCVDLLEELLGVELLGISFDHYDSSIEIYPQDDVEDIQVSLEKHEEILALVGCQRYWINFPDSTQRYLTGARTESRVNRWDSYNRGLQLAPRPHWNPIQNAPTDNKRPLYLARISNNGTLIELDFDGAWEYWQESHEMPEVNGFGWTSNNGIEQPTHWAFQDEPLPIRHINYQSYLQGVRAAIDLVSKLKSVEGDSPEFVAYVSERLKGLLKPTHKTPLVDVLPNISIKCEPRDGVGFTYLGVVRVDAENDGTF